MCVYVCVCVGVLARARKEINRKTRCAFIRIKYLFQLIDKIVVVSVLSSLRHGQFIDVPTFQWALTQQFVETRIDDVCRGLSAG